MAAHLRSSLPPVDIPTCASVPAWVLQNAARYGNRPALIDATSGQRLTYTSLVAGVQRLASGLYRRFQRHPLELDQDSTEGVARPRRPVVCVYSAARIEFPIIVHAVLLAGGTVTTADGSLTTDNLTRQFEILLPDFIITDHNNVDDAKFAASRVGAIKEVFVLGKSMRGHVSLDELLRDDGRAPLGDVTVDFKSDVSIVPFDSDSRGQPRGVMHSHHSFNSSVAILGCPDIAPVSRDDVVCCGHQMTSTIGLVYYCGHLLREGATAVLLPQFNHKAILEAITKYKVNVVHVTPGTAEYLATDPRVARSAMSGIRRMYCSGAPLREGVIGEVMARSGITEVREGFGPAEAPIVLSVKRGDTLPGYAGQVCPNTEVQIRDILFGGVLEPQMYGEICVRGPQVMMGYLCKSEQMADQVFQNGWLHTRHIGQIDESANFSLLGRIDDLIDYDSFQISPIELERVVRQHPDVEDACVIGMDNHGAGHVPRAYVIKKPGADVIEADIRDYVAEEVVPHKRLRGGVVFIADIPKSTTGEPRRYKLQAQANRQELDISLGECAQWPPDEDYIDDMQYIAGRSQNQSSMWGQMIGMESFNFSSPSAADQGSGVFSHSSLKFDSGLDGFITTRDKNKTKTPEAQPPPLSPIRKNVDTPIIRNNHIPQETPVVFNNHVITAKDDSIEEKVVNVVRFNLDDEVSEYVQSEGGVGVASEDIPDLTPLTVDCQPPMSTSTPKHSPRHRSRLSQHTPVIQLPDPEPDITPHSYDQSSLYPNTESSVSSSAQLSFEKALQEEIRPEVRKDWISPGRPGLMRKRETSLEEAMNLDGTKTQRSRKNVQNLGGNPWKSTGDLSGLAKSLETSANSEVQSSPVRASERPSRIDSKMTAAHNIRMRATQYGQHVRSRELGLHPQRRNLSSYRDSFNKSGSSSGSILYSPRSKSSDRSSYLSSSRAYPSFSLTSRFDLV